MRKAVLLPGTNVRTRSTGFRPRAESGRQDDDRPAGQPAFVPRKAPGDVRHQQSLELLLGRVSDLGADWCQGQPVQHFGHAARAQDQLSVLDAGERSPSAPERVGPKPVEPGIESIPALRRIQRRRCHDAEHRQITSARRQRAHHRSREGCGQGFERRSRAERAQRLLLSVQIALERAHDRRVTQGSERTEAAA